MPSFPTDSERAYHYGGGGSLGLNLSPRRPRKVQPFFDANIGLLGFTNETPVNTRRTNFSLQFGPGISLPLSGRNYAAKCDFWVCLGTNFRLLRLKVTDRLSDAGIATVKFAKKYTSASLC
jgi:hypothetical protein